MTPVSPVADTADAAPAEPVLLPLSALQKAKQAVRHFIATRRFTLISSLAVITMCAVLLGLGTWQILRLQQKNALIAHITDQITQPERDLRLHPPINHAAWLDLDYCRVVVQGTWLDLYQLKVLPRTYEGENGYHLLVPLRLQNGQIVMVNRGWVPDKTELGPNSQNGENSNNVLVAGVVRQAPLEKPFGMMDNNPAHNEWAWLDLHAIADTIGVANIAPVILYAERAPDTPDAALNKADTYPIGGQVQLEIRNEHKQYALTWYALALALLVIWLVASKQPVEAAPVVTASSED